MLDDDNQFLIFLGRSIRSPSLSYTEILRFFNSPFNHEGRSNFAGDRGLGVFLGGDVMFGGDNICRTDFCLAGTMFPFGDPNNPLGVFSFDFAGVFFFAFVAGACFRLHSTCIRFKCLARYSGRSISSLVLSYALISCLTINASSLLATSNLTPLAAPPRLAG